MKKGGKVYALIRTNATLLIGYFPFIAFNFVIQVLCSRSGKMSIALYKAGFLC
jgi:hypothetical protein